LKVAIYCRVSTDEQALEGTSLESQLRACKQRANELGAEVHDQYTIREVFSGLSLQRPGLDKLRDLAYKKEIDVIIAFCLDRLTRDPVHYIVLSDEFERAGVKLEFATETFESNDLGRLIAYIKAYAAKLEAGKIKERSARGRKMRIERGKLPTGRAFLYGYNYDKTSGLNIANDSLEIVRMAGMWLLQEQISLTEICRRLMAKGIPAPKGGTAWSRSTVSRILRNPAYAGKEFAGKTATVDGRRLNRPTSEFVEIPSGVNKTVFAWDEYQAIQKQLARNFELSPRHKKLSYLLAGYIFCGIDGLRYTGTPAHGKPYYRCSSHNNPPRQYCRNIMVNGEQLEANVWAEISSVLTQPNLILKELYRKRGQGTDTASLEQRLEQNVRRLKVLDESDTRYLRLYGFGNYTLEKLDHEHKRIEREKALIDQENKELEKQIADTRELLSDIQKVEVICNLVAENIDNLTFAEKRLILEALKIKVRVNAGSIILEGILPVTEANIAFQQA
jgi:site-specific DNA recombinase